MEGDGTNLLEEPSVHAIAVNSRDMTSAKANGGGAGSIS